MDISTGAGRSYNCWYNKFLLEGSPLEEAYQEYTNSMEPGTEVKSLEDWCKQQSSKPMFKFWFTVLQLQLTPLVFVRSIWTGNFQLYVQSLTKIVSWFFSLDHYNHANCKCKKAALTCTALCKCAGSC